MATKKQQAARRAFLAEQRAAAEAEGRSFPPDGAVARKRTNPVYKAWAVKSRPQGNGRSCYPTVDEWTDRMDGLGFERFAIYIGERPAGFELQMLDRDKPFGPGNAEWRDQTTEPRIGGKWRWAPDTGLEQERAEFVAWLVAEDATGKLAEYQMQGLFVRDADANYLYSAWKDEVRRCHNKGTAGWKNYGGRGIRVHEDWRNDFETYAADLLLEIGPRPSPAHSIDRRNNNRGYEPGNLRWATSKEQQANRGKQRKPEDDARLAHAAEKAEWDRMGIPYDADGLPFPDDLGDSPCYCEELGI